MVRQRARLDGGPARERRARPRGADRAVAPLDLGIVGLYPAGAPAALEVRAAWPEHGSIVEDPATGSLNASVARWLIDAGRIRAPYVATQGGAIGRAARFAITQDPDGTILVGGRSVTLVAGSVDL